MKKNKPAAGILYADLDTLPQSEWVRIFYRNNPDSAYERISQLENLNDRLSAALGDAYQGLSSLLKGKVNDHEAKEKQRALRRELTAIANESAKAVSKRRAEDFTSAVQERINAAKPGCKTRHIVAEIMQLIKMDTAQVNEAIKTCGSWGHVPIRFPRKSKGGAAYSCFTVRDKVEKLTRA